MQMTGYEFTAIMIAVFGLIIVFAVAWTSINDVVDAEHEIDDLRENIRLMEIRFNLAAASAERRGEEIEEQSRAISNVITGMELLKESSDCVTEWIDVQQRMQEDEIKEEIFDNIANKIAAKLKEEDGTILSETFAA